MDKTFCTNNYRKTLFFVTAYFLLSVFFVCNPAIAKKASLIKSTPTVQATDPTNLIMIPGGGYLFRFRVPVNITLAKDLENHTGSSSIKITCTVHPANDTNYTKQGGSGFTIINLTNHTYNGIVTVDVKSMENGSLPQNMTRWRCIMMAKDPNYGSDSWSVPILSKFSQPGSTLSATGVL